MLTHRRRASPPPGGATPVVLVRREVRRRDRSRHSRCPAAGRKDRRGGGRAGGGVDGVGARLPGPVDAALEQLAHLFGPVRHLLDLVGERLVAQYVGEQPLVLGRALLEHFQLLEGPVDLVGAVDLPCVLLQRLHPRAQRLERRVQGGGVGGEGGLGLGGEVTRHDPLVLGGHRRQPGELLRDPPGLLGERHAIVDGVDQAFPVDLGGQHGIGGVLGAAQQLAAVSVQVLRQDVPVAVLHGDPQPAAGAAVGAVEHALAYRGDDPDGDRGHQQAAHVGQPGDDEQEGDRREDGERVDPAAFAGLARGLTQVRPLRAGPVGVGGVSGRLLSVRTGRTQGDRAGLQRQRHLGREQRVEHGPRLPSAANAPPLPPWRVVGAFAPWSGRRCGAGWGGGGFLLGRGRWWRLLPGGGRGLGAAGRGGVNLAALAGVVATGGDVAGVARSVLRLHVTSRERSTYLL